MKYWSKTPEFLKYVEEHSSVVAKFYDNCADEKIYMTERYNLDAYY